MKNLVAILMLVLSVNSFSQNPGNVGTVNLTAWFKPDALALGNLTNWTTTFPVGVGSISVTDNTAPYPFVTNVPAGNSSNYNSTIEFAANSNTLVPAIFHLKELAPLEPLPI